MGEKSVVKEQHPYKHMSTTFNQH